MQRNVCNLLLTFSVNNISATHDVLAKQIVFLLLMKLFCLWFEAGQSETH